MQISKKIRIVIIILLASIILYNIPKIVRLIYDVWIQRDVLLVRHFPFSDDKALRDWEEKIFKGKVLYRIDRDDYQSFVLGQSDKTASAMYYKIRMDMKKRPVISWKWNARRFPVKGAREDLGDASQDDYVARVYVIFPSLLFTNSKALEYIWTETIPEGTIMPSPYSKNLQLIVAQSGKGGGDTWVSEHRDIYEDYLKAFGKEPRSNVGAIAFMTDSDSTDSTAESFYDEIRIGYKMGGAE